VIVPFVVVRFVVVAIVGMLRLDQADAPGKSHAPKQGRGEPEPVVGMKRQLRQEVGQRNAQKHPRRKRQASAQDRTGVAGQLDQPHRREQRRHRAQQRKGQIRPPDRRPRPSARRHQRRDRQGVQRLVQGNRQEGAQSPQPPGNAAAAFGNDRRPQCHAVD
jgi:hypothetical protein